MLSVRTKLRRLQSDPLSPPTLQHWACKMTDPSPKAMDDTRSSFPCQAVDSKYVISADPSARINQLTQDRLRSSVYRRSNDRPMGDYSHLRCLYNDLAAAYAKLEEDRAVDAQNWVQLKQKLERKVRRGRQFEKAWLKAVEMGNQGLPLTSAVLGSLDPRTLASSSGNPADENLPSVSGNPAPVPSAKQSSSRPFVVAQVPASVDHLATEGPSMQESHMLPSSCTKREYQLADPPVQTNRALSGAATFQHSAACKAETSASNPSPPAKDVTIPKGLRLHQSPAIWANPDASSGFITSTNVQIAPASPAAAPRVTSQGVPRVPSDLKSDTGDSRDIAMQTGLKHHQLNQKAGRRRTREDPLAVCENSGSTSIGRARRLTAGTATNHGLRTMNDTPPRQSEPLIDPAAGQSKRWLGGRKGGLQRRDSFEDDAASIPRPTSKTEIQTPQSEANAISQLPGYNAKSGEKRARDREEAKSAKKAKTTNRMYVLCDLAHTARSEYWRSRSDDHVKYIVNVDRNQGVSHLYHSVERNKQHRCAMDGEACEECRSVSSLHQV